MTLQETVVAQDSTALAAAAGTALAGESTAPAAAAEHAAHDAVDTALAAEDAVMVAAERG